MQKIKIVSLLLLLVGQIYNFSESAPLKKSDLVKRSNDVHIDLPLYDQKSNIPNDFSRKNTLPKILKFSPYNHEVISKERVIKDNSQVAINYKNLKILMN